jgi:iron complex outermembrane recepter protein
MTPLARALRAGVFGLLFTGAAHAANAPQPGTESALPTVYVTGEQ